MTFDGTGSDTPEIGLVGGTDTSKDGKPGLARAAHIVVESKTATTTVLTKRMGCSKKEAEELLERLETLKVVSSKNERGRRTVIADQVPPAVGFAEDAEKNSGMKETAEDKQVRDAAVEISAERLKAYYSRLIDAEAEIAEAQEAIKAIYSELKTDGFSAPTFRQIMKDRRTEPEAVQERNELYDLYREKLGLA